MWVLHASTGSSITRKGCFMSVRSRIQYGGSKKIRQDKLLDVIGRAEIIAAVGLEAFIALKAAGKKPDMFFGAREGVIEAAFHGIDCAIVIVDEEFTDFLKRLESVELAYVIHDLISP